MAATQIYALAKAEVFSALETAPAGLDVPEAQARLALYGPNEITEPPGAPVWRRWAAAVTHPMAAILWLAGGVMLFAGQPLLALAIWLVVLVNGGFAFLREYWAGRAVSGLKHFLPATARVTRGGQDITVPVSQLVPGDVLVLAEGDRVPADARVVEEYGMRVNNATLTGEAMPALKYADASLRDDLTEMERPNLIFASTSVVSGTARAVVYATGMLTQFGRIANLAQSIPEAPSRLQLEMQRLSRVLSIVALAIGAAVLLITSQDAGMPARESLVLAIGVVVAVIPEGLGPTLTLILAAGVQRLAQHGVLVKKLSTLEMLGNISVLCTDKSGTLTQNQMTVRGLWLGGESFSVSGSGYEPKGQILAAGGAHVNGRADLRRFMTAAALCNNARLLPPSPGQPRWGALGDQTEAALMALSVKGGAGESAAHYPRIHELPFDARRKRMCTIHRAVGNNVVSDEVAFIKGSPREVLQLCTRILWQGEEIPLTEALRAQVMAANDAFARRALRVLALACRNLPRRDGPGARRAFTVENVEQNLTFLGLAAMMDPPRPEVARAISGFRRAGIRMVMITGDYGLTAESLARRIGMIDGPAPRIVTGSDLDALSDADLDGLLGEEVLFARMAPDHKMRLVSAFQKRGEVVAVVGDGVNDAPALRKADIGVAMGISGTDVARDAASVVLTRDDFELILRAVEEGRAVYDNLRKFMTYVFASNVPEVLPFLLTSLFRLPLALSVMQILVIDLGTDLLPALALGMEKPEPDILDRPPRRNDRPLIDRPLLARALGWLGPLEALLCYAVFSLVSLGGQSTFFADNHLGWLAPLFASGASAARLPALASTAFLAGVIFAQVGNAFACRSEKGNVRWLGLFSNPWLLAGLAVQVLLQLALVYIRPVASALGMAGLPPVYWSWLVAFAPALYFLERARKALFRKVRPGKLGGV